MAIVVLLASPAAFAQGQGKGKGKGKGKPEDLPKTTVEQTTEDAAEEISEAVEDQIRRGAGDPEGGGGPHQEALPDEGARRESPQARPERRRRLSSETRLGSTACSAYHCVGR